MIFPVFLTVLASLVAPFLPAVKTDVASKRHCQVPCGIYGDKMRIDMMMEDAATIEKAMKRIGPEGKAGNWNQVVRWVQTKEKHAQAVQDLVSSYWLAQRIKHPKDTSDMAGMVKYGRRLAFLHLITVEAMKCKQTTDIKHVASLRHHLLQFSRSYFNKKDLKHIEEHHGAGHGK